mmetsp:Transcript_24066/g.45423  ORF Transcript_24066/g.45423 Transcript_24066/m.45423 type:complete len:353 (-) Transcript_24066:42-1100(-)
MALGPLVASIGGLATVAWLISREIGGYSRPDRFIIVTSPSTRNVMWAPLPSLHDLTLPVKDRWVPNAQILIDGKASQCWGWTCSEHTDRGLEEPTGLALHQKGGGVGWLYVSDPKVGFLYRYEVSTSWRGLQADTQQLVASDLKDSAHWLAVDGYGNLFYTDAKAGLISMISSEDMSKGIPKGRTLMSSGKLDFIAGPAGIAADAMNVYWANLKGDQKKGTLLKAQAVKADSPQILAGTSDMYQAMVKDVCLAGDNVFFTGDGRSLFAVKADGSSNATEVALLKQPRGCAYDQENTLFVADSGSNAVFSLPANMRSPRRVRNVTKVAALEGPHQIGVFFGPSSSKFLQHLSQ